jgi:arylsulfatase A-like enzyme
LGPARVSRLASPMPPDLILLLCDTARADAFAPWGAPYPTPTVERLGREGIVYAAAYAQAPWTVPSTASIFCGRLPTEHGITGDCFRWVDGKPTSPAEAVRAYAGPWLPDQLQERGYATWGASCNSWVSVWGGFDRGFQRFEDLRPWARGGRGRKLAYRVRKAVGKTDRGGRDAVLRFGRRLADAGTAPLFAFVNLMETHAPFDPPRPFYPFPHARRSGTRWLAGGPDQGLSYNAGVTEPPRGYAETLRALYAACARYEDWVLGRMVQAVLDRGRPSVVILVADHGEQLGEHGLYNHNSSLNQPVLHVPLAAWGHRLELGEGRVEEPVSLLGLADWVVALADGRTEPLRPEGPVVSEYEGTAKHNGIPADVAAGIERRGAVRVPPMILNPGLAVRDQSLKYVAVGDGRESLFDLSQDPGEQNDLAGSRPDVLAGFRPLRDSWDRRRGERPTYDAGEIAEGEIAEHLRELGYID